MPTAVIRYHIPDTLSSCLKANRTRNSSRHFDAVNGAFTEWINDCSLFTKSQRKAIKDAQIPLLLAHALPCATEAQLRTCVELTCLTVILDDLTAKASISETQNYVDTYCELFRNKGSRSAEAESNKVAEIMSKLISRVFSGLTPVFHSRVIDANVFYARSIQEARNRCISTRVTKMEDYVANRRASIGMQLFLTLTQWTRGIDLPDDVEECAPLRDMSKAVTDLIFIANDIYSYKKGCAADTAQHNIITVALRDPSTKVSTLQESFDYAGERFDYALNRFEKSKSRLPSFGGDVDLQLGRYIDGMMDWVVGNIFWSTVNQRYAVFDNKASSRGGIVTLKLGRPSSAG